MKLRMKTDDRKSRKRQIVGWIFLMLGMITPGALLVGNPSYWQVTHILHSSLNMSPLIVAIAAGLLILFGLASWFVSIRDVAYIIAAVFYAIVGLAYFIAILQGLHIGALFFAPVVLAWAYVENSLINSNLIASTEDKGTLREDKE